MPLSNTQPVATNDSVSMCRNLSNILINVQANDIDADGDLLMTSILVGPLNGTAILDGNQIKYTPFSNFSGTDYITYKICDNAPNSLCDNATLSIEVNELPSLNLGLDRVICSGDTISLGTQALQNNSYHWTPALNLSMSTSANPLAFPNVTTNYILTVTNTTTACANNDTLKIMVNETPIADAGIDDTICLGVTVVLGAAPVIGYNYLWNDEIGLDSVHVAQPNAIPIIESTYILTVTDSLTGCHRSDSVRIVLSPYVDSNAGNLTKICEGSSASLGGGAAPGYYYRWLPSEHLDSDTISSPEASPLVTTIYQLTVTDSVSGCQNIDLVEVKVYPRPIVLDGPDVSICLGDSAMIGHLQLD
jgi:hypothetical protein